MDAVGAIEELERRFVNTEIDWELLLEFAYRKLLDRESVVLDVGGHAGRHADVFAREIGCARVVVVEPLPGHAEALKGRYADLGGVEVIQAALGQASGTTRFIFNEGSPEESGIRERHYNDPTRAELTTLRVPLARLDDLCSEWTRLDFVKIDTEGGEVDILLGGQDTLARLRPVLSVEYGASSYLAYGKEQSTLFHLAEQFGYGLHDLFGHPIASLGEWERCSDSFYWDYLMVPRERHDEVERRLSTQWGRLWMSLK